MKHHEQHIIRNNEQKESHMDIQGEDRKLSLVEVLKVIDEIQSSSLTFCSFARLDEYDD